MKRETRDGDHGRRGDHYYCDPPTHPLINYRHAHLHDGPKNDCPDDDDGDRPRRPRPYRDEQEVEQSFVQVRRQSTGSFLRRNGSDRNHHADCPPSQQLRAVGSDGVPICGNVYGWG